MCGINGTCVRHGTHSCNGSCNFNWDLFEDTGPGRRNFFFFSRLLLLHPPAERQMSDPLYYMYVPPSPELFSCTCTYIRGEHAFLLLATIFGVPVVYTERNDLIDLNKWTNFESKESIFFIIFYIIVQHVKNIFPKFQINLSKILHGDNF